MLELIEPIAAFLFLFLLPMIGICVIPALFMGGVMVSMIENKEDNNE